MSDLSLLIARLEAAEEPSRDLDAEIAIELGVIPGRDWWSMDYIKSGILGRYTSSIDDAVSLAKRVLPGCCWELTTTGYKPGASMVTSSGIFGAYAANLPIAICLATLRALDQKGSSNG